MSTEYHLVCQKAPKHDILIVLGDLNAKIDKEEFASCCEKKIPEMLRRAICGSNYFARHGVRQNINFLVAKRSDSTVAVAQPAQDEWESAKPFEDIPGPKPLPLIGNIWRFFPYIGDLPKDLIAMQDHFYKKYGNIVKLAGIPGRNNSVFLYNPEDYEKVYRNEGPWPIRGDGLKSLFYYRKFTRKDIFEGITGTLGSQGEEWHNFRSKVNPIMLQPRSISLYMCPIDAVASDFIERIRLIRDDKLEMPSDFANELCKWALESIVYIALDKRLGCLSADLNPDSEPQQMINALDVILESLFLLNVRLSPWRLLSTPQWRKFVKASDYFNTVCLKYINEAMERLKNLDDPNREMTVLEKLLARDQNPKIAMVMALDMMTGAVDTTSFTSAIVLYFLAKNPDKQEIAFREIGGYVKEKNQPVTAEILNELKYLKACIKEAMRLRPVAIGNARILVKDMVLCGHRVPKGTEAVMFHSYLCRMERYFPEPEKYVPERWLKSGDLNRSQSQETHPFVFMPFGYGPRTCLGRRFAQLEMEILLAKIIRNFRVEYNYGEMKFQSKLLFTPVSPLKYKFVERE